MRKDNKLLLKRLVGAIILLALFVILGYSWKSVISCDYFRIKQVFSRGISAENLAYLKGRNIFEVNLASEAVSLLKTFPDYAAVRLVRVLPDRLFADFAKRKPAALIKLYKVFFVDNNGVIFGVYPREDGSRYVQASEGLPLITGLEKRVTNIRQPGASGAAREIIFALNIIKETLKYKPLKSYVISRIDVASLVNASIFVEVSQAKLLEVKLGVGNIRAKLGVLNGLISSIGDIGNIKYIDLRFKEPVIKVSNDKSKQ